MRAPGDTCAGTGAGGGQASRVEGASVGSRGSVLTPTPRPMLTPAHQGFLDPGPTFGRLCPCRCLRTPPWLCYVAAAGRWRGLT